MTKKHLYKNNVEVNAEKSNQFLKKKLPKTHFQLQKYHKHYYYYVLITAVSLHKPLQYLKKIKFI